MDSFKTNGIYARILTAEKQSIFDELVDAVKGVKNESTYEIVYFAENSRFNNSNYTEFKFCADHSYMSGEILGIADWQRRRGANSYAKFKNVTVGDDFIAFDNENFQYKCNVDGDYLNLCIIEKSTKKSKVSVLRFIPWDNNFF
jgi:hypothetical protein